MRSGGQISEPFLFFKGRVALYAVLKAIGVQPGDEVILPGFTCVVVPNAIIYLGAKPVYIDIDVRTYNINPLKIEEGITKRTKAIIAQHTYGIPAEMDPIMEIARRYNLHIIEDSCHSIGSKYKEREVGTFGDAAFFSSQWSKPVTTGLGGWAIINNREIRDNLEKDYHEFREPSKREVFILRLQYLFNSALLSPSLFWTAQYLYRASSRVGIAIGSSSEEELKCIVMPADYKKRMASSQKKILERRLKDIYNIIEHRRWVTLQYERLLQNIGMIPLKLDEGYDPIFLRYPLLVKDKKRLLEEAKKNRIEIGDWFVSPLHPIEGDLSLWGYDKGICPVAESISRKILNLPVHKKINEDYILKLHRFLEKMKALGAL